MGSEFGVAVLFEGTDDLHYYAKTETAPVSDLELKLEAKSDRFEFGKAIFPKWKIFRDPTGTNVEVYAGRFTVFVPIKAIKTLKKTSAIETGNVEIKITGVACTRMVCLPPFEKTLQTNVDWSRAERLPLLIIQPGLPLFYPL
jgi:hypothetical protein